ncbi:hypothetical protein RFI_19134, partial [Reticulomyxa filosa]
MIDNEIQLQKQLNTLKQQYENTLSRNKKMKHLLENNEIMRMEDAETLKQAMSCELHKLKDLEEAKMRSCDCDNDAILARMLQATIAERDALHEHVFGGFDAFRQHIASQLNVLKSEVVAAIARHVLDKDRRDTNWKREHALEQLNAELTYIERTIKQLKADNDATTRDNKDKDKQMRRLKVKMDEQEKELASHFDNFQSIQSKFDTQLKVEQTKTSQLHTAIDKLQRLLEKR